MHERAPHWVRHNQQERIPSRMIAFDTESRSEYEGDIETQTWRCGTAIRWRTDLKTGDHAGAAVFDNPMDMWQWVSSFCRDGTRTVVWCHNLGYDARISQVFTLLPSLGFRLEWCNLDRNVSSMTWRSDHGTLVFADTWTWLPMTLESIAPQVGLVKFRMPAQRMGDDEWYAYCMRDTEIVYHVVSRLITYIRNEHLGNWQPTGAGMAMATWRHKFLSHKILVHDDAAILEAERLAMYTGRAEAWRHGKLGIGTWTEVDFKNAYLRISAECKLPRKLHMSTGSLSHAQYGKLRDRFSVLCHATVDTGLPILPVRVDGKIMWPVGRFDGWYWDCEIDLAIASGARVKINRTHVYVEDYILRDWALWVMSLLDKNNDVTDPVVKTWIKHCSRALIGRLALRTPSWEPYGANPEGITGITNVIMPDEGLVTRMLHVGDQTLLETRRDEGRDSLPQVTGKIMAISRVRLWEAMNAAGLDNLAHVDTDSCLVNRMGLANLRSYYAQSFDGTFTIKGSYRRLEVWGPRAYRRDGQRVTAGIPRRATERPDGALEGERWASLSRDINVAGGGQVTVSGAVWHIRRTDPRRRDAGVGSTGTAAYEVAGDSIRSSSASGATAEGS